MRTCDRPDPRDPTPGRRPRRDGALSRAVAYLPDGCGRGRGRRPRGRLRAARGGARSAGACSWSGPDNGLLSATWEALGGVEEARRDRRARRRAHPRVGRRSTVATSSRPRPRTSPPGWRWIGPAWISRRSRAYDSPSAMVTPGAIGARVMAVDGFGNVQLNVEAEHLAAAGVAEGRVLVVNGRRLPRAGTFAELPEREPGLIVDSDGHLAIVVNRGNAAADARPGRRRRRRRRGFLGPTAGAGTAGTCRARSGAPRSPRSRPRTRTSRGSRGASRSPFPPTAARTCRTAGSRTRSSRRSTPRARRASPVNDSFVRSSTTSIAPLVVERAHGPLAAPRSAWPCRGCIRTPWRRPPGRRRRVRPRPPVWKRTRSETPGGLRVAAGAARPRSRRDRTRRRSTVGYAVAIAIEDHPVPHPTSRTRAGGLEESRAWTSGIAGSHSFGNVVSNVGRFDPPCPSSAVDAVRLVRHAAAAVRNAASTTWSKAPRNAISWVTVAPMNDSESPSRSTSAWPAGSRNRFAPSSRISAARMPAVACCSSHSRAYRSAMLARCGELGRRHRPGLRRARGTGRACAPRWIERMSKYRQRGSEQLLRERVSLHLVCSCSSLGMRLSRG